MTFFSFLMFLYSEFAHNWLNSCMHRKLIFVPRRIDIITISIDRQKSVSEVIHGIYRSIQQIYTTRVCR